MSQVSRSLVILAGGHSRRLGRNKSLVSVGGPTTLSRILDATAQIEDVVLAVRDVWPFAVALEEKDWEPAGGGADRAPGSVAFLGSGGRTLLIVPDPVPDLGPVAGLASGLRLARARVSVVLAGDLPFVTAAFADRVMESLSRDLELDAVVPFVRGRAQPLCAAYRSEVADIAAALLQESREGEESASMMRLLDQLSVRYVGVDALADVGDLSTITRGIDGPEDLEWATRHAKEHG